ncbi:MAG: hypothetical protein JW741_10560 [Sedimentisphaerales bacterium]|nr:hypothetical protein [Sedimentisphaerales bacterium]
MDLHVTINVSYPHIRITISWTIPPENPGGYFLYADGTYLNHYNEGNGSGSGYAVKSFSGGKAKFEAMVEKYLFTKHVYRVETTPRLSWQSRLYDEYTYLPADALYIENHVAGIPEDFTGAVKIFHRLESAEGFCGYDEEYHTSHLPTMSKIVSVLSDPNQEDGYELTVDTRPKSSTSAVDLRLSLYSYYQDPIELTSPKENELRLSLPGGRFESTALTLQQYDPADPNRTFPLYDVRQIVAQNAGILPLPDLHGAYRSGEPYAFFTLSFTRDSTLDLNEDGRLDWWDFSVLGNDWRNADAPTAADLAGVWGLGLPDGTVDAFDLQAFCQAWAQGYTPPVEFLREDFETGRFDKLDWTRGTWTITSVKRHSGLYCAWGGPSYLENPELTVTLECESGEIRFWRRVVSDAECSFLEFYIDGEEQARWSGDLTWEEVAFPVEAGTRTFTWTYVREDSVSDVRDGAWIDDITFPRRRHK